MSYIEQWRLVQIVDLQQLGVMEGSALAVLAAAQRGARRQGRRL
jgi:hypothetical protein